MANYGRYKNFKDMSPLAMQLLGNAAASTQMSMTVALQSTLEIPDVEADELQAAILAGVMHGLCMSILTELPDEARKSVGKQVVKQFADIWGAACEHTDSLRSQGEVKH